MNNSKITLVSGITLLLVAGCSFFEPGFPEDPDPSSGITWYQPYSPGTVVTNIQNSMEGRSITMYSSCLDSSFTFIADPLDTLEFWNIWDFSNWDFSVEQNTISNIFAFVTSSGFPEDSMLVVEFSMVEEYPDPAAPSDSAEIWRDYEIITAGAEHGGWDEPALGRAKMFMVEDDYGLWSLVKWEDYRPEDYTGDNYTWAVVKATSR